ncbi:MAG: DotU family type IV/VI secretion system protein [Alphaproteobacteria bacterium]|nr:DotU family type IV/VI secretion system protein [Alphaproteobacteria bacterium]
MRPARTVLIEVPAAEEAVPELSSRPDDILRYLGGLAWLGLALRAGAVPDVSPPVLHDRLRRQLALARRRAEQAGIPRASVDDATWATVALLDATLASLPGAAGHHAVHHPLELELFGSATAGHDLTRRLHAALERRDLDALPLYRLALLGGLQGDGLDPVAQDRLLRRIDDTLGLSTAAARHALAPPPAVPVDAPATTAAQVWATAAGVLAALALTLGLLVHHAGTRVEQASDAAVAHLDALRSTP